MADVFSTGSLLRSPKTQVNTLAAVMLTIAGWAHARIFALEGALAQTNARLAAVIATQETATKGIDGAIGELKASTAEQRSATARLEVAIARMDGRRWR